MWHAIEKEEAKKTSLAESRKETELKFAQTVQGTPLIIPFIEESDHSLFLMPVANDKKDPKIDRIYLVDSKQDEFIFERDVYKINYIKKAIDETKAVSVHFIAVVSRVKDGTQHEYEIDSYTYLQIKKMCDSKWEYKSNIKIPIVTSQ